MLRRFFLISKTILTVSLQGEQSTEEREQGDWWILTWTLTAHTRCTGVSCLAPTPQFSGSRDLADWNTTQNTGKSTHPWTTYKTSLWGFSQMRLWYLKQHTEVNLLSPAIISEWCTTSLQRFNQIRLWYLKQHTEVNSLSPAIISEWCTTTLQHFNQMRL